MRNCCEPFELIYRSDILVYICSFWAEVNLMNKKDLKKFRIALEQKRQSIIEATGKKAHWENMEDMRRGDFIDQASEDNDIHVNLRLLQIDAKLLRAIDAAIERIEKGNYGICTICEGEISLARLKAVPWTSVCIACKEKEKKSA